MTDHCDIPKLQNTEPHLGRLAAFSILYQRAKVVAAIQFALSVPAAVVSACIIAIEPSAKPWTTFFILSVALLDALVLERIQNHFRKLAARTQEQFDSELFGLEWRSLQVGEKPEVGDVLQAAECFKRRNPGMGYLKDWYPPVIGKVPQILARLVCQRTNCWWDSSLRKKYANALIAILVLVVSTVFIIALIEKESVESMILSVYAPIAPAVIWTLREVRRQHEAAFALDKLRNNVEQVWNSALRGQITPAKLDLATREIQACIFDGRSRNPLIFDWINRLVRKGHQISMNAKAEEMISEAIQSGVGTEFSKIGIPCQCNQRQSS